MSANESPSGTAGAPESSGETSTKSNPLTGYGAAFDIYHRVGWPSVLPLRRGKKKWPPKGYTGHDGATPSYADMLTWAEDAKHRDGNLALRLPPTVIGIDADNYDGKNGGATIEEAERRWGKRPYSPRSSARPGDPVSGIRLYRIPEGVELAENISFPELGLGGVEIIQHHHRYAVCWPSIHPDTGEQYRWYGIDAPELEQPPALEDLPELPAQWVEALRVVETEPGGADLGPDGNVDVQSCLTKGDMSQPVAFKLGLALSELYGTNCRHDQIRDRVLGLLRKGKNGELGVKTALNVLYDAFVNRVYKDRPGGRDEAKAEFKDFVYGDKVPALLADDSYDDDENDVHTGQRGEIDEIDEEKFWNACDELKSCRDYARAVRVAPWAMLGSALAIASATTPPHVVLPGIVGDYASVNLYVNLTGRSGAIKSQAIAAARAWLRTTPRPESVKPGSGQGIAKCFAYVKRTKGEPVQVGKRWTALAVIPEIDTLTAAGAMTSSSLWAEFRSAWSDERVGHDYTDATKTVVLQPRRYRLAMIVGVQPLRAQPLFDDIDAGTPQRFVWFPTCDPAAPDNRPEQPPPLVLPRWPGDETHNFDIDNFWAQRLDTPADRGSLTVLKIPAEAAETIDTVAREKLRGNPDIDPLDGHKLLCQLKVAAALMRLCNRTEVTSEDWGLAAVVMSVSDRTREQVRAELAAEATRRNLNAAKVSGARKIVETEMVAHAEAEDIARVAEVIVTALVKAEDRTLPGAKVSKAVAGRDRNMIPKALEYMEIDGRIKVEDIERRGQAGIRVTLLDDGEQTN
jgi:hypothetical protein